VALGLGAAGTAAVGVAAGSALALRRWRSALDPCQTEGAELPPGEAFKVETGDGAVLDGVVVGEGPTVVLSHGWTGNRSMWIPVAARLVKRGRRVVLYDQRGHGESTLGPEAPTIPQLGADLRAVLEAVDARDAVVAGHSMGGMAAQVLAIDHPEVVAERVWALVLVATGAARVVRRSLVGPGGLTLANPLVERLLLGAAGPLFLRASVGRRPRLGHLLATRDCFVATPAEVRLAFFRAMQSMDLRAGLASVRVPTTVVVGRRDLLTRPRLGRVIATTVSGARLVEIPDAGHLLPFEEPDLIADLIAEAHGGSR
jgi:pimeloyl-ACP methyl ester carboxylesterase